MKKQIAVIVGSTRPGRIGQSIAEWALTQLEADDKVEYKTVDLQDWKLPILDEPMPPMMHQYQNDHTKKWSAEIEKYDAFIFVTPEYNAGYPAGLKNAIDYLHAEWKDKPVTIISYGWSGGASANNQLKEVFDRIGMKIPKTRPELVMTKDMFNEQFQIADVAKSFGKYSDDIKQASREVIELL